MTPSWRRSNSVARAESLVASHLVGEADARDVGCGQGGDMERAREIDADLRPLYERLAVTTNPIPIKAALEMAGLIPSGRLRLPLVPADAEQRAAIKTALESVGRPGSI